MMVKGATLGFILGAALGSFVKAASDRAIASKTFWGRSYCESCHKKLLWYDLIPILSYIFLKGRCRNCHKKISRETLLVEIILGIAVALLLISSFNTKIDLFSFNLGSAILALDLIFSAFIISVLAVIFLTDLKTGLILDRITFPATLISLLYISSTTILQSWLYYLSLKNSSLGKYLLPPRSDFLFVQLQKLWLPVGWAIISGVGLAAFFALIILVSRGKGMGWGDVKYVLFLGIALGFPKAIVGIFLAFLIGAIFSVLLILSGKKRLGQTIPFGPFLSLGGYLALLWGNSLVNWYINLK